LCIGVDAKYVRETILSKFFRCYWIRLIALDKRNYKELVDMTVEIA
jgi:splicing factor 3B subunit 1